MQVQKSGKHSSSSLFFSRLSYNEMSRRARGGLTQSKRPRLESKLDSFPKDSGLGHGAHAPPVELMGAPWTQHIWLCTSATAKPITGMGRSCDWGAGCSWVQSSVAVWQFGPFRIAIISGAQQYWAHPQPPLRISLGKWMHTLYLYFKRRHSKTCM